MDGKVSDGQRSTSLLLYKTLRVTEMPRAIGTLVQNISVQKNKKYIHHDVVIYRRKAEEELYNNQSKQPVTKSTKYKEPIPSVTKITSFTAPAVRFSHHISPVTEDKAWVSDRNGNLVLTNSKGNKLKYNFASNYGCHTISDGGDLIFLNDKYGIITTCMRKHTRIGDDRAEGVRSIYCSPFNADILVGIKYNSIVYIIRYEKRMKEELYRIQYDNKGQSLYGYPICITENYINGDVCVSDRNKNAVVVVDKDRKYRFSYKGHSVGSQLWPRGISTDIQGHILVSDEETNTVQMIDKDDHFLSFLLTMQEGIQNPAGLSLDVKNNILWVGAYDNETISVYKYNDSIQHSVHTKRTVKYDNFKPRL